MAFSRAGLFKVSTVDSRSETLSGQRDAKYSGAGATIWFYSEITAAIADIDAPGYFADVGSTTGSSELTESDPIFVLGSGGMSLYQVTDAAAGTIAALTA